MRKPILCSIVLFISAVLAVRAQGFLYIQSIGDTLTVVPSELSLGYSLSADGASVMLVTGKTLVIPGARNIVRECPVELPAFALYRFNNKHNDQLFQGVTAPEGELSRDTIRLSVAQIGKSLTATFRLTDAEATAWVGSVRQESEVTRQRMENPVTYTIGLDKWRQLQLQTDDETGGTIYSYVPFGRQVTVSVDFLTDHPTGRYNVPRIDITTATGSVPMSKSDYISASITIDGGGVYPDMPDTDIRIKGRGNSSWSNSASSKNPYHLKFAEKQRPLGMKAGKHWILLSNKQAGSMLCNAYAQKASALAGCAAVCHIVPVELYINGQYRGSYNLTEKVGFHNNSVSLDDESCAAMLELDTYKDEPIWRENAYSVSTKIHDPDFDEGDSLLLITQEDVIADWNETLQTLRYGGSEDYAGHFDVDYLASFLFSSELCHNAELNHPKSVFLYSKNVLDDGFRLTGIDETPWIFGPVWDSDWSFGYEFGSATYFINSIDLGFYDGWLKARTKGLWYDLRFKSSRVDKAYYTLWHRFMTDGRMQELLDYVQDYYDYAAPSLKHNSKNVTDERDGNNYATLASRAAVWFRQRADFVYGSLTPYEIDEEQESAWPSPCIIDTEDGIVAVLSDRGQMTDDNWYGIDGRRLAGRPVKPGFYIRGGKVVSVPSAF